MLQMEGGLARAQPIMSGLGLAGQPEAKAARQTTPGEARPGTAKSQLVTAVASRFCDTARAGLSYFVYLLTLPAYPAGSLFLPRIWKCACMTPRTVCR